MCLQNKGHWLLKTMFGKGLTGTIKRIYTFIVSKAIPMSCKQYLDRSTSAVRLLEADNSIKLTTSKPPVDQLVC